MRAEETSTAAEMGTGMRSRPGIQAASPRPARPCPPPATHSQHQERHDHNEHTADDHESGLDAYIKELVDAAPPLTSEQRDTLALLLRRPRRR
jgi:hypothetical protein